MNHIIFITIVAAAYILYYSVVIGLEMAGRKRVVVDNASGKVDFVVAPVSQPVRVVSENVAEDTEQYEQVVEGASYSRELDEDEMQEQPAEAAETKPQSFAKLHTVFGVETIQNNYSGYRVSDKDLQKHLFHK